MNTTRDTRLARLETDIRNGDILRRQFISQKGEGERASRDGVIHLSRGSRTDSSRNS